MIDMTEVETAVQAEGDLPYGGTVAELRRMVAKHAQRGEAAFMRKLNDVPPGDQPKVTSALTAEEFERNMLAHYAAHYGWSVAAILRWLGEEHGPEAARRAACIVQDLGENGGNDWLDDLPYLWAVHVQGPDDILAAADRIDADRKASEINAAAEFARSQSDSPQHLLPGVQAVVVPWDDTPEEHAETLRCQAEDGVYTP